MFSNILVNICLEFSRIGNMVQTVVFVVCNVPVFIEGGNCEIAAVMYKALILREHNFIIVENAKK